jgi:hypothetical protein
VQLTGQVIKGPNNIPNLASGASSTPFAQDPFGAMLVSELNARYANLATAGLVFSAATTTGVALAALGTNSPIFTLWNPANSGKNLVLIDVQIGLTNVAFATTGVTATLGVGANVTAAPATTTAIVGVNNYVGNGNKPNAFTYSQATLAAAPTASRHIATAANSVLTTSGGSVMCPATLKDEIAGALIIAPGSLVAIGGEGTVADWTIIAGMTWAEIPV